MQGKKSCCAVVSLYYPEMPVLERLLASVCSVVDFVYLIDNSGRHINYCSLQYDNVEIVRQANSGITGAMNKGIRVGGFSYDYFLFLDQDSFFEKGVLERYVSRAISMNIMISAPVVLSYDGRSVHEKFIRRYDNGGSFIKVSMTQLSGMLVNVACLERVGLFDESYFLNLGDTEWCLRANKAGFDVLIHRDISIYHSYAEGSKKVLFYSFHVSEPFRLFYRSRDSVRLVASASPLNVKLRLCALLLATPFEIIFCDRKMERFSFFLKGFVAFFRGEKGIIKSKSI
jgi:GT2 family glycosyltransferase